MRARSRSVAASASPISSRSGLRPEARAIESRAWLNHASMVSDASRARHYPDMPERNLVWQSVARYFASALIAIVVITALGVFAFRRIGENEAIHDAKDQTRASAFWAIDPKLIDRVLESDRKALADLDRLVRTRILRGSS